MYHDGCDFITGIEKTKDKIYEKAKQILKSKNLSVKEEKTEYTTVKDLSLLLHQNMNFNQTPLLSFIFYFHWCCKYTQLVLFLL